MKLTAAPFACLLALASLAAVASAADVTSTWNGTTGNWSDASRWSSVNFPNNGNGGLTYDAIINSGTVTLDLNVMIEAFKFGGGALTGASDLTSNTLFTFSTGTLSGAGTTFAAGGLTLGTPNTKFLDGGRTLVNQGTATWSDGQINLNAIGAVGSGILINAAGAEFNNTFNGSLVVSSFGGDTGANSRFDNEGTFRKSGGTGITSINARFNNTGTVEVLTGTLELDGTSTHTGALLTGTGTIQFGGSGTTHTLDAATSVQTSNVTFIGGTTNINAAYNITGTTRVNAGTVNFLGTLTSLGQTLIVAGGTTNLGASNQSVTTLTVTAGTLTSTGNLTASGLTTFSTGTLSGAGTTFAAGGLTLGTPNTKFLDGGRTLVNQGTATWSDGQINLNAIGAVGSGILINAAGAEFNNTFNGSLVVSSFGGDTGANSRFDNEGTFRKSGGTGITSINARFNNTGTVEVLTGTLELDGTSTHTGALLTGTGTIQFGGSGTTHTLDAATSVQTSNVTFIGGTTNINAAYNITGTTRVNAGTVNFLGTLTSLGQTLIVAGGTTNLGASNQSVTTLTVTAGTLTSTGNLTASGLTTFSTGTLSGAGTTFAAGGLTLGTPNTKFLDGGRTLVNQGTATWSDGQINLNAIGAVGSGILINAAGAEFNNTFNGSLVVSSFGGDTGANSRFDNEGTFRKSGGTGITSINTRFNNTGTVEVLTGTLELDGTVPQHTGTMLTGGTWRSISTSGPTAITFHGSNINQIAADAIVELSGSAAVVQVGTTPLHNTLNLNNGTLRILNGHTFAPQAETFMNVGTLELGGTSLAGGVFNPAGVLQNSGTVRGHGQLNGYVVNEGRIEGVSGAQLLPINGLLGGAGILKDVEINSIHSPGFDVSEVDLEGMYSLTNTASLAIDIGRSTSSVEYDRLNSTGTVNLAGHLDLQVRNLGGGILVPSVGQQFPIITSTGAVTGSFVESTITTLASGVEIDWNILYSSQAVTLEVTSVFVPIPGDYNRNQTVDAADYVLWRKTLGTNLLTADGNQNGEIDSGDFDVWRAHFGETTDGGPTARASVSEPATILLIMFASAGTFIRRRIV